MGLGLPGFSPGSADRNQLKQAVKKSDSDLVERTMLEDKIRATGESILIFNRKKNYQKGSLISHATAIVRDISVLFFS